MAELLYKTIAWQGFEVEVPERWEIDAVSGDDAAGYLQASDGVKAALEIKWSTSRKAPKLDAVVDQYARKMEGRKRKPTGFTVERRSDFMDHDPAGRRGFVLHTEGKGRVYGFASYNARSRRVMLAQIGGTSLAAARRALESLSDRLGEPGWNRWRIYGLEVDLPDGFRLRRRYLVAGYIYLHFGSARREFAVERWAPAGELLRDRSLEDWIVESRASEGVRIDGTFERGGPHGGIRFTGRRPFRWSRPKKGFSRLSRRWIGQLWVCEQTNRLYGQHVFHTRRDGLWVDELAVVCHTPDEEEATS